MSGSDHDRRKAIFISHQWSDKHIAHRLQRDLRPVAKVWLDIHHLKPGRKISTQVEQALSTVDAVLVLWSANSAGSEGVRFEIETAQRQGIPIYPVTLDHDETGRPNPPLPASLSDVLGFELHHYGTTAAQILAHFSEESMDALPPVVGDAVRSGDSATALKTIAAYLAALRYCNATKNGDRETWVREISRLMTDYIARNGKDSLPVFERLLDGLPTDNPDFQILREDIRRAAAQHVADRPQPDGDSRPSWTAQRPRDPLEESLGRIVPPQTLAAAVKLVQHYVQVAPTVLGALQRLVITLQSPAGCRVVTALANYLQTENDLIPDRQGTFGLLDDAWIIHNTAFALVNAQLIPLNAIPVDPVPMANADVLVRGIIPRDTLEALAAFMASLLREIAQEVNASQFHAAPRVRSDGTWEDLMDAGLSGSGTSTADYQFTPVYE